MTPTPLEQTLYDLFAGRATPLQKKVVEEWLRDPANRETYYLLLSRWEADHAQYTPDTDVALAGYTAFLTGQAPYPRHQPADAVPVRRLPFWQSSFFRASMSIAASVAVVVGLGWLTRDRWQYERITAPYGQTRTVNLADGSTVTLNAHSTLRSVRRFWGQAPAREVWLDGEGYFSISRTPDRQKFVVHTANLNIEVLGTKFNVNTRRGQTEVVLNEGKVQLTAPQTPQTKRPLLMKPGDYVALAEGDTSFRKVSVVPDNYTAWQQSKLVFNETPLSQVAQRIEDFYGIRVVLANRELARRELTGTLPNNDLNVVLKTLSVSYNVAVERQRDRIVLR